MENNPNNPNNPNDQNKKEFYKNIKNFARAGLIIGCIQALFLLINSLLGGEVSFVVGTKVFSGVTGMLSIVIFIPLFMMLIWILLGVVSFMITMLGKWVMRI